MSDITFDEVVAAYYDCRRNKRNTAQQIRFEFHLEKNLWNLYEDLKNETYRPGSHIYFIITKPKPREVWAANFRDRIVHHILYNRIFDVEKTYIKTSYACLKNRGTLKCAKDFQKCLRKLWKDRNNYRYLQVDIANFYVSIDKEILKEQIKSITDNLKTIELLSMFADQNPTKKYFYKGDPRLKELIPERKTLFRKETGLPIGNLTSQMFANLYLNHFDHWVLENITPYYYRYLDDMVLILPKTQSINKVIDNLNNFLGTLNLKLNSSKTKHNVIDCGVNLAGYIIKPFSICIRNSTKYRAKRATERQSINSYYGMFCHINCYSLRKSIAKRNNLKMFYYQKIL
jgi:RNA-directed DNA polymerase